MSSLPKSGPNSPPQSPTFIGVDFNDIANYETFMDSLLKFMNECTNTVLQYKRKSGISAECGAPVKMNEEEKRSKMNDIVSSLSETYRKEASQEESAYRTALDFTPESDYTSPLDTGFTVPSSPSQFRPPASSTPCSCPPDVTNLISPSRYTQRQPRADTPRPRGVPIRGRVPTPDRYYVPSSQSYMNALPCAGYSGSSGASKTISRGRGRPISAYPDQRGWSDDCPDNCRPGYINNPVRQ